MTDRIRRLRKKLLRFLGLRPQPGAILTAEQMVTGVNASEFLGENYTLLREALDGAARYAEYGAGSSTLFVQHYFPCDIRSVESDPEWAAAVAARLTRGRVIHIDLGPVGKRGRPVSLDKADMFPKYFEAVFSEGYRPDVVFVDGRFRVACFLTAVLNSQSGTRIVFDDYPYRSAYHVVEQILPVTRRSERQALFVRPPKIPRKKILELLEKYSTVMD